jgi:hypothetical protein
MSRLIKTVLWSAVAAIAFTLTSVGNEARADRYWNDYWGWYDGQYVPQQHRYYYRNQPGWQSDYYYRQPGRSYYYDDRGGYGRRDSYYRGSPRGGSVQVGPLRFGWR